MKEIPITFGGKIVCYSSVSDEDYESLSKFRWGLLKGKNSNYVVRSVRILGVTIQYRMHRVIMDAAPGYEVDHIDGNGLNNTRNNLRVCTKAENQRNQKVRNSGSSHFKGVHWNSKLSKWVAQIQINGNKKYLGLFAKEGLAAIAYNNAAKEFHGEFAKLNTIVGVINE